MSTHKQGISYRDFFFEKDPIVMITYSGQKCPCDGTWETIGTPKTRIVLAKDQLTPSYLRKNVYWRLRTKG